jgi:beta-carotene hydroxylase
MPNGFPAAPPAPSLHDLGADLLRVSRFRRAITLIIPFACVAIYLALAFFGAWPLAVMTLMYLSFATYGSISHDLVHRNLGLSRGWNEACLTIIELLAFRSGHAYRLAHLHHHARFPHDDDIEGEAAKMSLGRALLEGVIFQPRIMIWAIMRPGRTRRAIVLEVAIVVCLLVACITTIPMTPVFVVYAALMIMGSWVIPLVTSYVPHDPAGPTTLQQTRLFRGKVASILAMEHLYHLEHHLYPQVPHHNWPKLARRLDPFFHAAGVRPVILKF